MTNTFLLRIGLAVIFLAHSAMSIFSGDVNHFGKNYLDHVGFAPFGVYLAWTIKLTHLVSVPLLLLNKWLKAIGISNIIIFVMGIILIHAREGWFVVGGGRNGMEFNFLLIVCLLSLMFPDGIKSVFKK